MEKSIAKRFREEGFEIVWVQEHTYNGVDYQTTIIKDGIAATSKYKSGESPINFYNHLINIWYYKKKMNNYSRPNFTIKKVIFNPPATIVFWTDGTKTVVKAQNNDLFDYEKGLTMAIAKKAFGNKGNYFEQIKKWTKDQPGIIDCTTAEVIMYDCAEHAYQRLLNALHDKKATKADLGMAMEEAVGYLGQILDD